MHLLSNLSTERRIERTTRLLFALPERTPTANREPRKRRVNTVGRSVGRRKRRSSSVPPPFSSLSSVAGRKSDESRARGTRREHSLPPVARLGRSREFSEFTLALPRRDVGGSAAFEHRCAQETFAVRLIPRGVYYPDRARRLSAVVEEGPEHRRASDATLPTSCLRSSRLINAATRSRDTSRRRRGDKSAIARRVSTRSARQLLGRPLGSEYYRARREYSTWPF